MTPNRHGWREAALELAAWVLLAVSLLAVYARVANEPAALDALFTGDTLYLSALHRDLMLEGGRWSAWRGTPAPYLVPDLALMFAILTAVSGIQDAAVVYAFVQVALWAGALRLLRRFFGRAAPRWAVLGVAGLVMLHAAGGFALLQPMVLSAFHFSLVPSTLFGLALLLRPEQRVHRWGLVALSLVMAASDALFIVSFVVPAQLALAAGAWRGGLGVKPAVRLALWLLLACLVGFWGQKWLLGNHAVLTYVRFRLDLVEHALRTLWAAVRPLLWSPWFGAWCAAMVFAAVQAITLVRARNGEVLLWVFVLTSTLGTISAVVLSGTFFDASCVRYLALPAVLPLCGLLAALDAPTHRPFELGACCIAGIAAAALNLTGGGSVRDVLRATPGVARCIDEKLPGAWGLAGYWTGRRISLFSTTGARAHPLQPNGDISHWNSSRDWYLSSPPEKTPYRYIAISGLDADRIRDRFGAPSEVVDCPESALWVYDSTFDDVARAELRRQLALQP